MVAPSITALMSSHRVFFFFFTNLSVISLIRILSSFSQHQCLLALCLSFIALPSSFLVSHQGICSCWNGPYPFLPWVHTSQDLLLRYPFLGSSYSSTLWLKGTLISKNSMITQERLKALCAFVCLPTLEHLFVFFFPPTGP